MLWQFYKPSSFNFTICPCMCVCVALCVCRYPQSPEDTGSPETDISCEPPDTGRKLLWEQKILLTTELSLQPHNNYLKTLSNKSWAHFLFLLTLHHQDFSTCLVMLSFLSKKVRGACWVSPTAVYPVLDLPMGYHCLLSTATPSTAKRQTYL